MIASSITVAVASPRSLTRSTDCGDDGAEARRRLLTDAARTAREIRAMLLLIARLQGRRPQDALDFSRALRPEALDAAAAADVETAVLVEQNARLVRDLRGLQVLVSRLGTSRPGSAHPNGDGQRSRTVGLVGGAAACGTGRNGRLIVQGRVIRMPRDGSCLFHSLAYGLGGNTSAVQLRQEIADFIEEQPETVVGGSALKDWIMWESGEQAADYATCLRSAGEWGGAIEMSVCSLLRQACIHVYFEADGGDFQLMCSFNEVAGPPQAVLIVRTLYRPGHYDAFEAHE
eukprot:TRINITY_DN70856_c0_g1_i1.p1 TRINITY_DN70856_c0_g1~~TRINITY_DN70856_c0_g1_i1.p1  ORF type:complete len:288 (+),score=45.49 TRINITY_DN70856_c0_g1_i1:183-1046(+)